MMIFGLMMCFSKKNQNSKENKTKSAFPADFADFNKFGRIFALELASFSWFLYILFYKGWNPPLPPLRI